MILIMGLAGSGKGTQGKLLAEDIGYRYLSTGEFLRAYITEERRKEMAAGNLINDDEMIGIIKDFLSKSPDDKCILDGFPRSKAQADWLIGEHNNKVINIEALIYINVPKTELIRRLLLRGRHDDTEPAIRKRFEEYSKSTSPIIDDYKKQGVKIIEIDGKGSIEDIQSQILKALGKQ